MGPRRCKYRYAAYGLTIELPFRCLGLPAAEPHAATDVVVEEGIVPRRLASPVVSEEWWDAEPGSFLLRGGRLAGRFLVEAGRVTVERNPGGEDAALARCFTGTVLAAVLRQRGALVLHAGAACTGSRAVLVAGRSGTGKSTTLAALLARGCAMLADDVTVLRLSADGDVEALAGAAELRLAAAPAQQLKAVVSTGGSMAAGPVRVDAIYLLGTHPGSAVSATPLTGTDKFDALQRSIYGPLFVEEHPALFSLCAALLRQVDVHRLQRPDAGWSVDRVADVVAGSEALA